MIDRGHYLFGLGTAFVLAGCASARLAGPSSSPAAGIADPGAAAGAPGFRWSVEPVVVPASFQAAVAAGTRTLNGAPGPDYWTQKVDYSIEATLDPATAVLEGSETITYHNRSPDALGLVLLHLYQNLFTEGAQRTRTVPITGGITIERVAVAGREFERASRPERGSFYVDSTLMGVYFDEGLPPGDSIDIEIDWRFEIPPQGAPRHGHIDNVLYNVGQWYPQVATYDDLDGWHTWPYLGNGEFYLEYGDFDVGITVPEGWLVGASGTLQNPEEVLTDEGRSRLAGALEGDDVVRVVTEAAIGAGTATRTGPAGSLTWRFSADGVRDFAFATSNQYVWDATRAITPDSDGDGQPETVAIHSLYRPTIESWSDSAEYMRHSVTFHAERWHPYPWPQMTGAEGPVGGMEYPMLTFVAAFPDGRTVYEVLNHEIGHMWYPMMVGSNEPSYPWMDEGLATYIEDYATGDYWDDPEFWRNAQNTYLAVAGAETETPVMRHADLHGPTGTYTQAAYMKPATLLRALEGVIGRDAVWESLATYADRWIYGHPHPLDFFNTVETVAGQDLDWFWYPFWYETAFLDQAISSVAEVDTVDGPTVEVTVADLGTAPMPVVLVVTLSDGETVRAEAPVGVWLAGSTEHVLVVPLPDGIGVAAAELDPAGQFPDVDRDNNRWEN